MDNVGVVVVGSCMTDLISYVSKLPRPGETLHGDTFQMGFGGKGANQCIAAAKLGAKTAMVAKVGMDVFGKNYIQNFRDHKVNCDHVLQSETHSTGMASILVAKDGSNAIVIVAGANLDLLEEEIDLAEGLISKCKVLVCQLEIRQEVTLKALKMAKKHGVVTILNPAPALADINEEIFKYSDFVCPNEVEAEIITGSPVKSIDDATKAVSKILSFGCSVAVVTLGSQGCIFATKSDPTPVVVSARSVVAVDTTGAGDAFVGTLAYCLSYSDAKLSPKEGLEIVMTKACAVASLSVLKKGTQDSYPYFHDLPEEICHTLTSH